LLVAHDPRLRESRGSPRPVRLGGEYEVICSDRGASESREQTGVSWTELSRLLDSS
jgi:hypothetical protein